MQHKFSPLLMLAVLLLGGCAGRASGVAGVRTDALDDAAWDAFQAQVEALGASRWLEVAQAAYDRSVGK